MRFAISLPQFFADGTFDPGAMRDFLARAEELDFDSAWTLEQVLGEQPVIGPIETMTYAAAHTERIRLGCAVLVTTLHNPVHLAKSLASLDQISNGRLDIGVGTGGSNRPFAAFGIDGDGYVARFTEGLRLMRALWTDPEVTVDGRFWRLHGEAMEPKPVQKPHPPLWFGATAPPALRRAVRLGDGFFGGGSQTTAAFAEQVVNVRAELAAIGRNPASFPIAKRVYLVVDEDTDRARRHVTDGLRRIYGGLVSDDLTPVGVFGPPEDCVRGLREVARAGADLILLTPLADPAAQMERLAAEVLPHVR